MPRWLETPRGRLLDIGPRYFLFSLVPDSPHQPWAQTSPDGLVAHSSDLRAPQRGDARLRYGRLDALALCLLDGLGVHEMLGSNVHCFPVKVVRGHTLVLKTHAGPEVYVPPHVYPPGRVPITISPRNIGKQISIIMNPILRTVPRHDFITFLQYNVYRLLKKCFNPPHCGHKINSFTHTYSSYK